MAKRVAKHVFCWCFVLNYDLKALWSYGVKELSQMYR